MGKEVGGANGSVNHAGLRSDAHLASHQGAAQKALQQFDPAGCLGHLALEVGSGPPWVCARAATVGASLVQAPESWPRIVEPAIERDAARPGSAMSS
ncbi:hypothetical protein GCM10009868_39260 [Terrabacter aerolatus]|uniref:Uncharacterized protein n=1 Tax=Terrabacter aerolatus TaxID=422442 RepID=A0A512D0G7_9MICO|nr:hypothetical protein TAE01_17510 [Terrabacter aerolatus]